MYKIDKTNLKKEKSFNRVFFLVGMVFLIICSAAIIAQGFFDMDLGGDKVVKDYPIVFLFFIFLICGISIFAGLSGMRNVNKKIKKYEYLAKNGKLIKGLQYRMTPTGSRVNDRDVMKIIVDYELPSGSWVQLESDGRFDFKMSDSDGLVDLLIDPFDSNNYYIDFNIEEDY